MATANLHLSVSNLEQPLLTPRVSISLTTQSSQAFRKACPPVETLRAPPAYPESRASKNTMFCRPKPSPIPVAASVEVLFSQVPTRFCLAKLMARWTSVSRLVHRRARFVLLKTGLFGSHSPATSHLPSGHTSRHSVDLTAWKLRFRVPHSEAPELRAPPC